MSQANLIRASKPFIDILTNFGIDYYVGGSVASSAHGLPRTTIDVDIRWAAELQVSDLLQRALSEANMTAPYDK